MRQYQQQRIWNQIKYSYVTIFVISVISLIVLKEDFGLLQKYFKIKEVRDKVNANMNIVQKSNDQATDRLKIINTDRGIEGYIRQAYPVVKNGEEVVALYNASTSNVINIDITPSWYDRSVHWLKQIYLDAIIDYTNNK